MSADPPPSDGTSDPLSGFLRQVVAAFRDDMRSDATLLTAFAAGDQEAFRVLVGRHGRSVWAACLAQLGDPHDAEDAFQAAFMALARRAASISVGSCGVGPWVRTAARRAARQLRRASDRLNRLRERLYSAPPDTPPPAPDETETWVIAAAELDRLAGPLRQAVVMYHLEGRTLAQVAEAVGCSVAEVHRRVERGLAVLRAKLSARGVALTGSVLAALPVGLVTGATARATEFARGAEIPPRLAALVDAALTPRLSGWMIAAGATVLLACGTALGFAAWPAGSPTPAGAVHTGDAPPAPALDSRRQPSARPTAALAGRVLDSAGKPVTGASVAALVRRPWLPGDRGLRDEVLVHTDADTDGRYRIDVPTDFHTHYPERAVTLMVTAPGHPPATRAVVLKPGTCDLWLSVTRTVRGEVVAPDGNPAEGVRVGVLRLGAAAAEPVQGATAAAPAGWPADVTSGKDGTFAIAGLPAGESVWLEVRDDRFALVAVRVPADTPDPVRVTLAPPRVLRGRVTAADTGRPLAGARVGVFAGPWESHHDRYTAMTAASGAAADAPPVEFDSATAADGTYCVRLPPVGPYRVFVHPPAGAAHLAVGRAVDWPAGQTAHALAVALPAGEVLRGVLVDERGHPIAGGWVTYDTTGENRHAPPDMLVGRDEPVRSAADGSFRLAVPPGPGVVQAFGPHANYLPATYAPRRCSDCGAHHLRRFEHARADLVVPPGRAPEPVSLVLRTGVPVSGRAVGPDGGPVPSGVLVCRPVVQPLRSLVTRPLLIRDGTFELPGCSPGRVYPVVLLDPERLIGGVAEMKVGNKVPVLKLEPCGTAEVRLVDLLGRPLAGVTASASVLLACDRVAGSPPPATPGANPVDQSWFDAKHHLPGPVTDADGKATLRALVPGAEYVVRFLVGGRLYTSAAFRVKAGQTARLPQVAAGRIGPAKPNPPQDPLSKDD